MPRILPLLSLLCYLLSGLYSVAAGFVNFTIDDKYGDPSTNRLPLYSAGWHSAEGKTCDGCFLGGDSNVGTPTDRTRKEGSAVRNTWHESLNQGSDVTTIQLTFQGSKIYIYGIIFYYSTTSLSFKVDGVDANKDFLYSGRGNPNTAPFFTFNVLLYSNENLAAGMTHTIEVINKIGSLAIFDYAVYEQDDGKSTTTQGNNPGGGGGTGTTTSTSKSSPQTSQQTSSGTQSGTNDSETPNNTFQTTPGGDASQTAPAGGSDTPLPNQAQTNATTSSGPSGGLIGGVVAGLVVLLLILALLVFMLCRRKRQFETRQSLMDPMPYYSANGSSHPPMSGAQSTVSRSSVAPPQTPRSYSESQFLAATYSTHRRMSSAGGQSQSQQTTTSQGSQSQSHSYGQAYGGITTNTGGYTQGYNNPAPEAFRPLRRNSTSKHHMDSGWRGEPGEQRDIPPSYTAD